MDALQAYLESQVLPSHILQQLSSSEDDASGQPQLRENPIGDQVTSLGRSPPSSAIQSHEQTPSNRPCSKDTSECSHSGTETDDSPDADITSVPEEQDDPELEGDEESSNEERFPESGSDEELSSEEEVSGLEADGEFDSEEGLVDDKGLDSDEELDSNQEQSTRASQSVQEASNTSIRDHSFVPKPRIPTVDHNSCPTDQLSITISDDQSVAEKIEERHLLALRILLPEGQTGDTRTGNHALQDFQMQLMLLEQQNKKRLMMARQEQDKTDIVDVGATANGPTISDSPNRPGKRAHEAETDVDFRDMNVHANADIEKLDVQQLQNYIQRLQTKVRHMSGQPVPEQIFQHKILYRLLRVVTTSSKGGKSSKLVFSSAYFDPPEWFAGEGTTGAFRCSMPVENLELYLEKNKDIAFIVYRTYVQPSPEELLAESRTRVKKSRTPTIKESIRPIHSTLVNALRTMLEGRDEYSEILQTFNSSAELTAPYMFCYHHYSDFDNICASADATTKIQLHLCLNHVMQTLGGVYREAEAMISQGNISHQYMEYLFKPGDTIVQREDVNDYTGWVATSWPKKEWTAQKSRHEAELLMKDCSHRYFEPATNVQKLRSDKVLLHTWSIHAWQWGFDVTFYRRSDTLRFYIMQEIEHDNIDDAEKHSKPDKSTTISISKLKVMPLRFCPTEIVDVLRKRGQTFWKCRERRFVSYREDGNELLPTDERYMVDVKTYKSLHKNDYTGVQTKGLQRDDLGEHAMKQEQCPQEQFELLLPLKIKGFNMRRKKWYDLTVDRISDVVWRKDAFTKVVMDPKAKEIVRALISKQLASERSTDLIAGKGNGLILLLHGGPGTGKTLTAESVAEIAEKPLYRVTCGDVGTKAEAVEKYLESVFHLGKQWGCVVLVDEADVFLEQRDLQDLDRNALVSVFLRVLEYYEGILVLTSNRVGTFDEAFRSRIQLALHYPTLNQSQRLRIWENFIDRLESFNDEGLINISDLRYHLEDLSQEEMNGREIRNAITTARQYAEYMGTTLTYHHLKDVIEISGRFDKYLGDLRGGFTQDELKKELGVR